MIFRELDLAGVFLIAPERHEDVRGWFARTWSETDFAAHGLNPRLVQCSVSYNRRRGTLRGMHFQAPPHEEAKLIRCTRGAIWDVALDLRPGSPTFRQHAAVELTAENHHALYVPEGMAHGFQTLRGDTEVLYQMSAPYVAEAARGVRYDDPAFGIAWPVPNPVILERDRTYPDFAGVPV